MTYMLYICCFILILKKSNCLFGLFVAATVTVEQLSAKVKGQAIPDQHGSSSLAVGKVEYDVTK